MAFTIGSGTFTNGSATVTGVTLTSGTLAYFASGTRMVVGVNPVIQEVEAIAAPTVSTITLRSAWTGTGGTYSFLANQTSEGLRDAVQAIRTNNASLQSFIDSIDTAATANSVAQRTSDGSINAVDVNATRLLTTGNVGVGTSSPSSKVYVNDTSTSPVAISINNGSAATSAGGKVSFQFNGGETGYILNQFDGVDFNNTYKTNRNHLFLTGASESVRIDSSGNVGIGTSSPSELLSLFKPLYPIIKIESTSYNGTLGIDTANGNLVLQNNSNAGLLFGTNSTERMRIDTSGNVGIGTSSPGAKLDVGAVGEQIIRLTSIIDGSEADPKGSSLVFRSGTAQRVTGSIKSFNRFANLNGGDLVFSTADSSNSNTERMRIDSSGNVLAGADNTQTLGGASKRWSVVYAGTGSINTSDAREKTPVQEFTADELNAAKQLSKEIGTYKFLSAVAKKGDDARKHVGMTVQRAIEIMEANNLDPFAYGFICYDAWEEKTVDHPAVEAVEGKEAWTETVEHEAKYDEDGEVIKEAWTEIIEHQAVEAVEAKDAYTEVVQEAGDRYSFRPDEMLFFIARGLEARIEALEG